ncbi:MAG: AraC family transcriptional regulator [Myxococcota bacterium]
MTPLPPELVERLADRQVQAFPFHIVMDALDLSMAIDWDMLLFGIEGLFELQTDDASWRLPPTRAAWVKAGTHVAATTLGAVRCASVYFRQGFAEPIAPGLRVFEVTPVVREMVLHAQQWSEPAPGQVARIERFYLTLLDLCRPLVDVGPALRLPRAQSSDLQAALRFTRANLGETLSISEVADAVETSPRTLMRRLRSEIHMTWGQYLQSARLIRAMECLADGMPVTETSITVGYGSLAAFSTAFRRFTGVSPREYQATF